MALVSPSFSKVNIGLKVLNQRDDGYHNIYTVFQETDFGDLITIEKTDLGCMILSNVDWIPRDESNTCYKAYNALKTIHPKLGGVSIKIDKNIPTGIISLRNSFFLFLILSNFFFSINKKKRKYS